MKILLESGGPTVTLSIAVEDYLSHPPAKWRMVHANAVTIELQALAVEAISIEGWSIDNRITCEIKRMPDGKLSVNGQGKQIRFNVLCGWIRIAHVLPYLHEK
jgi:predicted NAD/FAD-binding protein